MISTKSDKCHKLAVHMVQLTFGLSVGIVIAWFPFEYKNFYRDYTKQHGKENYEYFNSFVEHTFPLVSSILTIIFYKVVFLKRDCKLPLIVTLLYIPTNILGANLYGKPVYW